jgi:hypothetical protein
MKLQRFEVSENPHLTIECLGDLDVNGGREGEVAIKAYGDQDDLTVHQEDGRFEITARVRTKIGCPRGTTLTVRNVQGDLKVRHLDGAVSIVNALGDCLFRDVGPTTVTHVAGDVRGGSISGDLVIQQVSGDLSVRGVEGLFTCETVGGDLSAGLVEGGLVVTVGGDASLKTDFVAGEEYQLTTGGDAVLKFPTAASASFHVQAGGDIVHKVEWTEVRQAQRTLEGRLGEGEADVTVSAGGDVVLKSRSDAGGFVLGITLEDEELELELESMAEEIERNVQAHMARLNAELEEKLSSIDHEVIRDKAERAASKMRRAAERAAERARLKAERAQRRWERMEPPRPPRAPTAAPGAPPAAPRSDPVTDNERMMVLNMVREGKITSDEAASLLEALEG